MWSLKNFELLLCGHWKFCLVFNLDILILLNFSRLFHLLVSMIRIVIFFCSKIQRFGHGNSYIHIWLSDEGDLLLFCLLFCYFRFQKLSTFVHWDPIPTFNSYCSNIWIFLEITVIFLMENFSFQLFEAGSRGSFPSQKCRRPECSVAEVC